MGLDLAKKYRTLLNRNGVNTPLRLAHFFAQIDHESGLRPVSENLNYSAAGLAKTFRKYFPTVEIANKYARVPQRIANRVYANRMGNGDELSGDGWRFRGRGFIQITGRDNYERLSLDTKVDYLNNPDWLLREPDSMISALWYWRTAKLNRLADADDLDGISDLINIGRDTARYGDANGYADRKAKLEKYKKIFVDTENNDKKDEDRD